MIVHKPGSQADQAFWYGVVTFAFGLVNFFASPVLGAISDCHGRRPVLLIGFCALLQAAALALAVIHFRRTREPARS